MREEAGAAAAFVSYPNRAQAYWKRRKGFWNNGIAIAWGRARDQSDTVTDKGLAVVRVGAGTRQEPKRKKLHYFHVYKVL